MDKETPLNTSVVHEGLIELLNLDPKKLYKSISVKIEIGQAVIINAETIATKPKDENG